MYDIRVDTVKNRLYVTLTGFFALDEIKKCGNETIEATKRLRPGYDVVTDITQFKVGTPEVAEDIKRVQHHFSVSGVRQGVRIVGRNPIAKIQFRRTGSEVAYNSTDVATPADAEALLDNL